MGVQQLLDLQAARALMKTAAEVLECMGRWHRYPVHSVVYLIYWYKSTNTGSAARALMKLAGHGALAQVRPVYFLYWYKSTNTDALLRRSLLPVLTGAGLRAHLYFCTQ